MCHSDARIQSRPVRLAAAQWRIVEILLDIRQFCASVVKRFNCGTSFALTAAHR
jgi:hypothetical protein